MKMTSTNNHVDLLWTGGWDSTFQLLKLLIIDKCSVTPYYLIDAGRPSTGVEVRRISHIKKRVLKDYPQTMELFNSVQYFSVDDIAPDSEITEAFRSILEKKHLGSQYDWLARFCKSNGITDMQLSIVAETYHNPVNFDFEQLVSEYTHDSKMTYRIDPKFEMMPESVIFRYFSFPTIRLTKLQMAEFATQQDWKQLMKMTWFCHNPTNSLRPCGKCTPCLMVIDEGLGWRIPAGTRFISFFYRHLILPFKRPVKMILKKLGYLKYA